VRNNRTRSLRRRTVERSTESAVLMRGGERYACGSETVPKERGRLARRAKRGSPNGVSATRYAVRAFPDLGANQGVAGNGTGHAELLGERRAGDRSRLRRGRFWGRQRRRDAQGRRTLRQREPNAARSDEFATRRRGWPEANRRARSGAEGWKRGERRPATRPARGAIETKRESDAQPLAASEPGR